MGRYLNPEMRSYDFERVFIAAVKKSFQLVNISYVRKLFAIPFLPSGLVNFNRLKND